MKRIILAIYSFLLSGLQFLKIYEYTTTIYKTKPVINELGQIEIVEEYLNKVYNLNFIEALRQDFFPTSFKVLALIYFIVPIITGLYFLFSKKLKIDSRNLDLIFSMLIVTSGLMVFMITNTLGHVISLLPILVIVISIVDEIRR